MTSSDFADRPRRPRNAVEALDEVVDSLHVLLITFTTLPDSGLVPTHRFYGGILNQLNDAIRTLEALEGHLNGTNRENGNVPR